LKNMKNLFINNNSLEIQIDNEAFVGLESIQNIHISKTILNYETSRVLIDLFKYKNRNFSKVVLKRHFYKSLFLTANCIQYDCDMTLFFIENNVHYNFKTET